MNLRIEIGASVVGSPVGPGRVTAFTDRGYPKVDGGAVAWLRLSDGTCFDPHERAGPRAEVDGRDEWILLNRTSTRHEQG